jgi:putative membrane protein
MASSVHNLCLVAAIAAFSGVAFAQAPQQPTPPPQAPTQALAEPAPPEAVVVDEAFIAQVVRNSKSEVELGKMALLKSARPDVKLLAQRMVDDHTKFGTEAASLARSKGTLLPEDEAQKDRATLDKLDKLKGEAFDRMYVTQMMADQRRTVDAFTERAEKATDPILKAWAAKTLVTLQQHLEMVREVDQKLGS